MPAPARRLLHAPARDRARTTAPTPPARGARRRRRGSARRRRSRRERRRRPPSACACAGRSRPRCPRDPRRSAPTTAPAPSCCFPSFPSRRSVSAGRPTTSRSGHPASPGCRRSYQVRPNPPKARTGVDTSERGHRYPGQDLRRVRPRFGLRPYASDQPTQTARLQHRDLSRASSTTTRRGGWRRPSSARRCEVRTLP